MKDGIEDFISVISDGRSYNRCNDFINVHDMMKLLRALLKLSGKIHRQ